MANRGVNKVILVGHLGNDPDVKHMQNGNAVANLTLATSESWRDRNSGETREKTEWHRVVVFGKLAEIAGQYLRKGSQVYIEGQLQTRKWQNQQGQDQYTTEIVVQGYTGVMQMLGSKNQNNAQQNGDYQASSYMPNSNSQRTEYNASNQQTGHQSSRQGNYSSQQTQQPPQSTKPQYDDVPDFDDDIPF